VLEPQFENAAQQRETATLGMWVFLATEVMLFGGLFTGLVTYRGLYPAVWAAASHHLDLPIGAVNTAVLLTSSLVVALGVHAVQLGRGRSCAGWLLGGMGLGCLFLGLKAVEYHLHFQHHLVPGLDFRWEGNAPDVAPLFFTFYFFMTGLHALHVTAGVGLLGWMAVRAWLGRFSPAYYTPVELVGLYWHLVDIIWIFLFPLLYLVGHR
jgi:cytochrome c oxidase subunit 3